MNDHAIELKRLAWVIRKRVLKRLAGDAPGLTLSVAVHETIEELVVYLQAEILGHEKRELIILNCPDGFWQWLRCGLGLSYRRQTAIVRACVTFPQVRASDPKPVAYLEVENVRDN